MIMPYAVTHILSTIFLVDLFRHHIKEFPRKFLILVAFFALVPDLDIVFGSIYNLFNGSTIRDAISNSTIFHGMIAHAILFPLILCAVAVLLYYLNKPTATLVVGLLAFSWFWHIFLDFIIHGESYPLIFWPFYNGVIFKGLLPLEGLAPLDAIVFLMWIIHEEYVHKIKSYF